MKKGLLRQARGMGWALQNPREPDALVPTSSTKAAKKLSVAIPSSSSLKFKSSMPCSFSRVLGKPSGYTVSHIMRPKRMTRTTRKSTEGEKGEGRG